MIEYPISTERITWKITNILQLLIMQRNIVSILLDKLNGIVFVDIGQVSKATH